MEDNYMATTRNGHELKDMYNPETNTLDIRSNGLYPSNVLSNLCSNAFVFDGVECGSMEGFLQSLKCKDEERQKQICAMKGGEAKKRSTTAWQKDQILWWKGQAIDRQELFEYSEFLKKAYQAMFEQNERFRKALLQTRGMELTHESGNGDCEKTILTSWEFTELLTDLRDFYADLYLQRQLYQKGIIKELGVGKIDCDARGLWFGIPPLDFSDWKLVVRTNAFQFVWEKESQIIDSYSKGLKVESITVLEDKRGSEILLNPLPLENGQDLHVLATNFCGEFYVKFYVRRSYSSWDLELDSFDYIYK